MNQYPPFVKVLLVIVLIIVVIFSIITAQDIFEPLVLGMLIALLLYPVVAKLERCKVPRIVANLIVLILALGLIVGVFFLVVRLFSNFLDQLPQMKNQFLENVTSFNDFLAEKVGISAEKQNRWIRSRLEYHLNRIGGANFFSATTSTIVKIVLVPVYSFLFLYYRSKFKVFLWKVIDNSNNRWEKIIREIAKVTPAYLGGSFIVVLILAVINSIGFTIIGLDQAILFGVIAAIFNFIPYLGTVLGYLIALAYAITTQSLGIAGGMVIQLFIVQFLEHNILTPNITGSRVRLNPFVVIVGLLIGGKVWGIIGMFVAVPLLAMLKIFFENTENLKPLSFLMGTEGTEKHSLDGKKIINTLKKLLSRIPVLNKIIDQGNHEH